VAHWVDLIARFWALAHAFVLLQYTRPASLALATLCRAVPRAVSRQEACSRQREKRKH
jgi:hypothetical protein